MRRIRRDGLVQKLVDQPGLEGPGQRLAVGDGRGRSRSTPAVSASRAASARSSRQLVGVDEHLDADVVGGDDAVEAPFVTQDLAQQLDARRGRARHPRRSTPA